MPDVKVEVIPISVMHRNPEIMGGELVFIGTRVPVFALFDYLKGGDTLEQFLDDFPSVNRHQAERAIEAAQMWLFAHV